MSVVSNTTTLVTKNFADQWIYDSYAYLLNSYPEYVVTVVFPFMTIILSYIIPCGIMFLLEYYDVEFLRPYKIQKKRNDPALLKKAVKTLFYLYFVIILPMYVSFFSVMGYFGFSTKLEDVPTAWSFVWQSAVFLLLEDFCHYWFHRWLHTPFGYTKIHHVHHEFTAPSSLSATYSHPLEVIIQGIGTFSGPLLFRPHLLILVLWVNIRQFSAVDSHSGYDFPFSLNNVFPSIFGGADFHDFHHRTYNGAYSSNFIYWDVLLGTSGGYFKNKEKREKLKASQKHE